MSAKQNLRFGVFIDNWQLKQWQIDCIEKLEADPQIELVAIIVNQGKPLYTKAVNSWGYRYLERLIRNRGPLKNVSYKANPSAKVLEVVPKQKGMSNYFAEQDIESIKALKLDFILRFGFGIVKGEILDVPTYGIWSFHHANVYRYRGGPTGFWDIFFDDPVNGAILQRLTPTLDGGWLLREGYVRSIAHNFRQNVYRILDISTDWPLWVAKRILLNGPEALSEQAIQTKAPLFKAPSNLKVFQLIFIIIRNRWRFHWQQLFRAEQWNIGVVDQNIEDFIQSPSFKADWAPTNNKRYYLADPFTHPMEGGTVLAEKYDYRSGQGHLAQIKYQAGNWEKPNTFDQSEFHRSYPFSLTANGKSYLLPEQYQSEELMLYPVSENGLATGISLLKGKWLDPVLFEDQGKWWLFCNAQEASNEALHLFYADQIEGPYQAHPLNPVVIDVRKSRGAGTPFYHKGHWYRPTQDCSITYGGSIQLQRIDQLNTQDYLETTVQRIVPEADSKFNAGIHTLSAFGKLTLVDGKRFFFSPHQFRRELRRKLKRLFRL